MKNIGKVIKCLREKTGLTAQELAHGICSSKYVYMIERGDRFPSLGILTEFTKKLKFDIFVLVPYLEFDNPLDIYHDMSLVEKKRRNGKYEELNPIIDKLKIKYEHNNKIMQILLFNELVICHNIYDVEKTLSIIKYALGLTDRSIVFKADDVNRYSANELLLYIEQASCCIFNEDFGSAEYILESIYSYFRTAIGFTYYGECIVYCYLFMALLQNKKKEYMIAIQILKECINRLLVETSSFRLHMVYYYIGLNFYLLQDYDNAEKHNLTAKTIAIDKGDIKAIKIIKELIIKIEKAVLSENPKTLKYKTTYVEIKNDFNELQYTIEILKPDILIVGVRMLNLESLISLFENGIQLIKTHFLNKAEIHVILDLRDRNVGSFTYLKEELKKGMELWEEFDSNVVRKSVIRVIDKRGLDLNMYESILNLLGVDHSKTVYQMDVPNLECALKCIKIINEDY